MGPWRHRGEGGGGGGGTSSQRGVVDTNTENGMKDEIRHESTEMSQWHVVRVEGSGSDRRWLVRYGTGVEATKPPTSLPRASGIARGFCVSWGSAFTTPQFRINGHLWTLHVVHPEGKKTLGAGERKDKDEGKKNVAVNLVLDDEGKAVEGFEAAVTVTLVKYDEKQNEGLPFERSMKATFGKGEGEKLKCGWDSFLDPKLLESSAFMKGDRVSFTVDIVTTCKGTDEGHYSPLASARSVIDRASIWLSMSQVHAVLNPEQLAAPCSGSEDGPGREELGADELARAQSEAHELPSTQLQSLLGVIESHPDLTVQVMPGAL